MKDALASTSCCPSFSVAVLEAFYHALQSPEAAAAFSPSLGGLPTSADLGYRSRYRTASLQASFPKTFLPEAFCSLLIAGSASCSFSLVCALKTEAERERRGERERETRKKRRGERRGRARKGEREREREGDREKERESQREGGIGRRDIEIER